MHNIYSIVFSSPIYNIAHVTNHLVLAVNIPVLFGFLRQLRAGGQFRRHQKMEGLGVSLRPGATSKLWLAE